MNPVRDINEGVFIPGGGRGQGKTPCDHGFCPERKLETRTDEYKKKEKKT